MNIQKPWPETVLTRCVGGGFPANGVPAFGGWLGISGVDEVLGSFGYVWIGRINCDIRRVRNKVVGTADFTGSGIDEGLIPMISTGRLNLNNIREYHVAVGQGVVLQRRDLVVVGATELLFSTGYGILLAKGGCGSSELIWTKLVIRNVARLDFGHLLLRKELALLKFAPKATTFSALLKPTLATTFATGISF
jgi:hypothetical protein